MMKLSPACVRQRIPKDSNGGLSALPDCMRAGSARDVQGVGGAHVRVEAVQDARARLASAGGPGLHCLCL